MILLRATAADMPTDAADRVLIGGYALVAVIQVTLALADCRRRAHGWPLWRCGPPVIAVVMHDLIVGASVLTVLGATPWAFDLMLPPGARATGLTLTSAGVAGAVLWSLKGSLHLERIAVATTQQWRPVRIRPVAPRNTARLAILDRIERIGSRRSLRWIQRTADRMRARLGQHVDAEVLVAVRLVLQECAGGDRQRLTALTAQAESLWYGQLDDPESDDASQERRYALLALVYDHGGQDGVRRVAYLAGRPARAEPPLDVPSAPATTVDLRPHDTTTGRGPAIHRLPRQIVLPDPGRPTE